MAETHSFIFFLPSLQWRKSSALLFTFEFQRMATHRSGALLALVGSLVLRGAEATCTDVVDPNDDCGGHGTCSGEPEQVCTCYGGAC